jgi:hypothetical protein
MIIEFKGVGVVEHLDTIKSEFIALGKYGQNTRSADCVAVDCSPDLNAAEQQTMTNLGTTIGCDSVTVN